jgi:putative peptidoglycan lipid II flippase
MNAMFVPWLRHAGLTLSISLGAIINAFWLYRGLSAQGLYRPTPGWSGFMARVLLACAVMGGWLVWMTSKIDWIAMSPHKLERAGLLAGGITVACVLYFATLLATGLNLRQFARRV